MESIDRSAPGRRTLVVVLAALCGQHAPAHADPVAGVGVYGGAVAAHQAGISSYGVGGGLDIQYPINDDWSINPFVYFSLERSSSTGYDLLDGLGGVQIRRWFSPSWYAGADLASHNTAYRLPGSGVANAAALVAPGAFWGAEFASGYGFHLQVNYEPTLRPYLDNSGSTSAAQRISGSLSLTYRWREDGQGPQDVARSTAPGGFRLSDLVNASSSGDTNVVIGLAYSQKTYKVRGQGNVPSNETTTLTDNGSPTPILDIYGKEKALQAWPLKAGDLVVGWNWTASLGYIDTPDQITHNGIRGQKIGTGVTGGYLGVAPLVFVRTGPLSAREPIYARLSLGAGPGLINASGTGWFDASATQASAGTGGTRLGLYTYAKADLEIDRWVYSFTGSGLNVYSGSRPSVQTYGFGVAYRFSW